MRRRKNTGIILTPEQKIAAQIMLNQDAINLASTATYSEPYRTGDLGYGNSDTQYTNDTGDGNMIDNVSIMDEYTKSKLAPVQEDEDSEDFDLLKSAYNLTSPLAFALGSTSKNTYRYILQNLANVWVSSDMEDIRRDNVELHFLDLLEKRNDILDKIENLQNQSGDVYFDITGGKAGLLNKQKELDDLYAQLNGIDNIFKTDGLKYDVILDNMFDYDKETMRDFAAAGVNRVSGHFENSLNKKEKSNYDNFLSDTAGFIEDLGIAVGKFAAAQITTGYHLTKDKDFLEKDYLRNLDDRTERDNQMIDRLYKNGKISKDKIEELRNNITARQKKNKIELNDDLDFAKRGRFHSRTFTRWLSDKAKYDVSVDLYDKPDEEWLKEHEEITGSFFDMLVNPSHALAEIGSSIALYSNQLYAMGIDYAIQKVSKSAFDSLNPGKKARWVLDALVLGFDMGQHIYFTKKSREEESKGEATEAIGERIAQNASQAGVDLAVILPEIKNKLDEIGIDTRDLELSNYMQLASSFGIRTSDDTFNAILSASSDGINKLLNANNALALSDYLQSIPLMNYGGKLLSGATKSLRKGLAKTTSHVIGGISKSAGREFYRSANNFIYRGLIDAALESATTKWLKKSPSLLLRGNTVASWVFKKSPYFVTNSLMEGVEEGQQYLLQQRFNRGEYDSYSKPYSIFDIEELVGNAELATTSIMDYYGIGNDKDSGSENLVKAMNIGTASALAFSNGQHFLTNFTGSRSDNFAGLLRDLKTDKMILDVMASDYDNKNTRLHANAFYEVLKNGKTSASDINQKLRMLQKSGLTKDLDIEDEWIDDDMIISTFLEVALQNPTLTNKEELNKHGIKKGSDDYKKAIVESAIANYNVYKNFKALQNNVQALDKYLKEQRSTVEQMFSGISDENLEKLQNTKLGQVVKRLLERFDKLTQDDEENIKENKKRFKETLRAKINDMDTDYGIDDDLVNEYMSRVMSGEDEDVANNSVFEKYVERAKKKELKENLSISNASVFRFLKDKVWKEDQRDGKNKQDMIKYLEDRKNEQDKLVDEIYEYEQQHPVTKQDFVLAWLARLDTHKRMQAKIALRDRLNDKAQRLSYLKRVTGLNISVEGLLGMIDSLDEQNEKFKGFYDNSFKGLENIFNEGEWEFDNEDEYTNLVNAIAMNNAARNSLDTAARAFMFGVQNPRTLRDAVYGRSAGETEYSQLVKEFDTLDADLTANKMKLSQKDLKSKGKQKQDLSKEASWKFILSKIQTAKEIEQQEVVDAAENMSKKTGISSEVILNEEENLKEENKKPKRLPSPADEKTDAEKRAEEQYGNAGVKNKKDERFKKEMEKRKNDLTEKAEQPNQSDEANDDEDDDSTPFEDEEADAVAIGIQEAFGSNNPVVQAAENGASQNDLPTPLLPAEANEQVVDEQAPEVLLEQASDESFESITEDFAVPESDKDAVVNFDDNFEYKDIEQHINYDEEEEAEKQQRAFDSAFEEDTAQEEELSEDIEDELIEQEELDNTEDIFDGEIQYNLLAYTEDGRMTYDGQVLPVEIQKQLEEELLLLGRAYYVSIDQEELPTGKQSLKLLIFDSSNDEIGNLVSNTFFYQPDATEPMFLTLGKEQIYFNKPLASGSELAKKLATPGWLQSVLDNGGAYYIVTASQDVVKLLNKKNPNTDPRDSLSVSLILEDEHNCYAMSLRNLERITYTDAQGKEHSTKGELDLRNELRRKNLDLSKVAEYLNVDVADISGKDITKTVNDAIATLIREKMLSLYKLRYNTEVGFDDYYKGNKLSEKDKAVRATQLRECSVSARSYFSKPGKIVMTEGAIEKQIQDLRNLRNQIIERYMHTSVENGVTKYSFKNVGVVEQDGVKKYKVQKSVKPELVNQSNGKINSVRDEHGNPVFRPIVSASTVLEVTTMLDEGELILGYGRGLAVKNDPWSISNIFGGEGNVLIEGTEYKRCGLSGKIYWVVNNPIDPTRGVVPIMLSEEKFDFQTTKGGKTHWLGDIDDLKLCLNINADGKVEAVDDEYNPSAAEVLLYMMCGKLSTGANNFEQLQEIVEFFIHHGENTLFQVQPRYAETNLNNFAMKQLHIEQNVDGTKTLYIALPTQDPQSGRVVYRQAVIDDVDTKLFASDEQSVDLRRAVVHAIATQMHWNTDVKHMQSTISANGTDILSAFVKRLIDENCKSLDECNSIEEYLKQSVSILGCPQLTFKLSDFYEDAKGEKGLKIKTKPVNIAAWMILNMKLKTDVGEQLFKDPFVFADGVKQQDPIRQEVSKVSQAALPSVITTNAVQSSVQKETVTVDFDLFNQRKRQSIADTVAVSEDSIGVATNEEERKAYLENQKDNLWLKNNGYELLDKILTFNEDSNVFAKDVIENFVKEYNKNHAEKITTVESLSDDETYSYDNGEGVISISVLRDKDGNVIARPRLEKNEDFSEGETEIRYSGVYSEVRGSGNLDINKAKDWLYKSLGINPYNVVLTNAIMRGAENEAIFGVTNAAVDVLTGEITGTITLSKLAGKGIHYHEAWHYVNLLMHTEQERMAIYDAYLKRHYLYALTNPTYAQVEERMAEDFRKYSEGIEDKSIFGKVKLFFKNVLDFLCIATADSKRFYTQIYEAIHSGEYNPGKGGRQINQYEVTKFIKDHPLGVYTVRHDIAGLTAEQRERLKSFQTYQQFYDATEAVIDYMINGMHLDNVDNVRKHVKDNFNERFKQSIDRLMQKDENAKDLKRYDMLTDLKDNPDIVEALLMQKLEELGFKVTVRKIQNVTEGGANEEQTGENDPDNFWDKLDITSSRKDNASASAKLFLRSIPKYTTRVEYDETTNSYVNKYVIENSSFGVPQHWSFDEAWNKILNELWQCTSYAGLSKDGKTLDPSSIRGRIKQMSYDPFFYALDKKLDTLDAQGRRKDDTQLKSQIFSTINSYKNPVSYIVLEDRKALNTYDDEDDDTDDYDIEEDKGFTYVSDERRRTWKMNDDSAFKASLSIPRTWSKTFASQGFVKYDKQTKQSVSSANKIQQLRDILTNIQTALSQIDAQFVAYSKQRTTKEEKEKYLYSMLYGDKNSEGVVHKTIKLANLMGMPIDLQTLDVLSQQLYDDDSNPHQKMYKTIQRLTKKDGAKGSLSNIVEELSNKNNISAQKVTINGKERTLDAVFTAFNHNAIIANLALAYNAVHPQLSDYVVKSPTNESVYPINMNNYVTDKTRDLNNRASGLAESLENSPYCWNSLIIKASKLVKESDERSKLKVKSFIGMKDADMNEGADYFGINPLEDYLAKMYMTMNDEIVFPTMADKKKWYSLSSSNIQLCHDNITHVASTIAITQARNAAFDLTEEGKKFIEEGRQFLKDALIDNQYTIEYINASMAWFRNLLKEASKEGADRAVLETLNGIYDVATMLTKNVNAEGIQYRRFSDNTLNTFAGYFMDELESLIKYYSKENIQNLLANPETRIDNFHGKPYSPDGGSTIRLGFEGNGGKFRYFGDIDLHGLLPDITITYGEKSGNKNRFDLNHYLQALYELQKRIEFSKSEKDDVKDLAYDKKNSNKENFMLNEVDTDGFELIRQFLDDLKNQVTTGVEGGYKSLLLDSINEKLIAMTEQELDMLSEEGSPLLICEKKIDELTGQTIYVPSKIPSQFLQNHVDTLASAKLCAYGNIYDQNRKGQLVGRSQAMFSAIANNVVNNLISVIEIEKIYSGDPAFYKIKSKSKEEVTIKYSDGQQVTEAKVTVNNITDPSSDKIKRLGGILSPGDEIRLDYSAQELESDPRLFATQYTNLNIEDIECESIYIDQITNTFKAQLIINEIRISKYDEFNKFIPKLMKIVGEEKPLSFEKALMYLYSNEKVRDSFYNELDEDTRSRIDKNLELQTNPYKGINVCDAQVFIRPELYRKIRIGLGDWSFKPDKFGYSDEEAYKILETDSSWMSDPEKSAKVEKFQLYALKMSYFGHENRQFTEQINANVPIYNKMAIFPMFKFHASSEVGAKIYNRMNLPGLEIDMISFKSAVKVGGTQSAVSLTDKHASSADAVSKLSDVFDINKDGTPKYVNSKTIDYTNDKVSPSASNGKKLGITVQQLKNIRLQLNTHAHEALARAVGTQMFKIAFSNVIGEAMYGNRLGSEIREDIMDCINKLTVMGVKELYDKFYSADNDGEYQLDDKKVSAYISQIIRANGLGKTAEEIIANGGVAAGLMSRIVFENSASVVVNDAVININTKGGTAIQQSVFGFSEILGSSVLTNGTEGEIVTDNDGKTTVAHAYHAYNDGKELVWNKENGTMEVLLTMNFFKSVIPSDVKGYTEQRQWLINHDVIKGTKSDGTQSDPKPFGIGYRIPTQGQSSMFAYTVADVLPQQVGDLIIVPREFTAQTGSDFDVDKLYLANMSYEDGRLVQDDNTKEGLTNRLLSNYMLIITDVKNYADARASIDTITKKIENELLDEYLRDPQSGDWIYMQELLPSYQALRKMEFGVGKTGIGPFALNVSNLGLTQATRLTFDYGANEYEFGNLYESLSKDGSMISAWLSAMVNAHVDVAKDPYVFALNVNQATYNHTNFLLRAGMGMSTFHFLAQPILKKYASAMTLSSGLYSGNSAVKNGDASQSKDSKSKIIEKLYKQYVTALEQSGDNSESVKNAILYFKSKYDGATKKFLAENKIQPKRPFSKKDMFLPLAKLGESFAEQSLKAAKKAKGVLQNTDVNSIIYQLCALETFEDVDVYAQGISNLIKNSGIDTKKFGNTIIKQRNWKNTFDRFREGVDNNFAFVIDTKEFNDKFPLGNPKEGKYTVKDRSVAALDVYYTSTFLQKKLDNAMSFTRNILKGHLVSATNEYMSMYESLCKLMCGEDENTNTYSPIPDQDFVQEIGNKLDNMFRYRALSMYGLRVYDPDSNMIDFTCGGNKEAVVDKMYGLLFGMEDKKSIFERLNDVILDMTVNPNKKISIDVSDGKGNVRQIQIFAYANLVGNGIKNDLLRYIMPMMPTSDFPVGKIYLANPQTFTPDVMKLRYKTAFYQLLQHRNPEIRQLAEDLAFYAYYSTYDQNTSNSFFDLVPVEYRKQYDLSLRMYLNDSLKKENNAESEASTMMDVICRNFWYDNSIVPAYGVTNQDSYYNDDDDLDDDTALKDPLSERAPEITIGGHYDETAKITFPAAILSTEVKKNRKTKRASYIKLQINGVSYIYKHVGQVSRFSYSQNGKKYKKNDVDIFIVAPKAGLHSNKQNQFEFYVGDKYDSVFEQNMLPGDFAEDVVRELILERIKKTNGNVYVNGNLVGKETKGNDEYSIIYFNNDIASTRLHTNERAYYSTTKERAEAKKQHLGFIKFNEQSTNPRKVARENSAVVVNFVTSPINREVENDKIIDVVIGEDVDTIAEKISAVLQNNDGTICFDSLLDNYQFGLSSVTDFVESINAKINERIQAAYDNMYAEINSQDLDEDVKESMIKSESVSLKQGGTKYRQIRDEVILTKLNEYISDLISAVYDAREGNKISSISSVAEKNKTFVARAVSNAAIACNEYITSNSNQIFIMSGQNTEFKRSPQFRKFKNDVQDDISKKYGYTSKVKIISEPQQKQKVITESASESVQDVEFDEVVVDNSVIEQVAQDNEKKNEECSSAEDNKNNQSSNSTESPFSALNGKIFGDIDDE